MDRINYPLLYFELNADMVLGLLIGTEFEMIEKDLRSLKTTLSRHLQKQYKRQNDYAPMYMPKPRLKVVHIPVKPSYSDNWGSYPLSQQVDVPVIAIHGETTYSDFECYLPMLNRRFFYYHADQLDTLIRHFATVALNQMQPEEIYQMMQYPKPKLDIVTLKVKERTQQWSGFNYQRELKTLNSLTERYPFAKSIQRKLSPLPEAAWELENKVSEVINKIISTRSNVLVVGNTGVGKSAVLKQAIRKITTRSKAQQLDYTFWRIQPQRITASARYLGEWQETCEALVAELAVANGILWVENVIQLLQTDGQGAEDSVAVFLQSFMQQGKLQIIGEATPQELESMRRLLPGFVASFQMVNIEELSEKSVQAILHKLAEYAERNLKINIGQEALSLAYRLLLRYYPYESFPGKGIKFLSRCISECQLNQTDKIDKQTVIQTFTEQTGLPELFLRDDLMLDQPELHDFFTNRIIGQPDAVDRMMDIVKVYKAGLNNPFKPISTLIFAGPTGVGKTASAKALADYFFGKGQQQSPLVRIDMSEFQHPGQLSRFIGDGQEVGQLVKEIRERPFAVLLLDEVEKADPSVFDALLTVLDEGILVDAFGRVTNFRNTIVIMTSNLGASNRSSLGFREPADKEQLYRSAVERHFRPEFFNRIDSVVLFHPLSQNDVYQITLKELDEFKQREGFVKRKLDLHFTERMIQKLADTGFDERYGARPLQRAIEQNVTNPMANWLLENPTVANSRLTIDYENGIQISLNEQRP